jgi:beta-phosphoglucomutase
MQKNQSHRLEAILVDLDDTLIFTKEANFYAYRESCRRQSVELSYEDFGLTKGVDSTLFLSELFPKLSEQQIIEIKEYKSTIYGEFLNYTIVNTLILDLLLTQKRSTKIGLVTNAKRFNCLQLLQHHQLIDLFDVIVNGDDVVNLKPEPEPYLLAMQRLNVKPSNCIAIEDSATGSKSAIRAGLKVLNFCEQD